MAADAETFLRSRSDLPRCQPVKLRARMRWLDSGVVPHNLPPRPFGYVRRGALEETMKWYLLDTKRRHLINLRGPGGFGKTSLILT